MIHHDVIYNNPIVSPGYYFAKVTKIVSEEVGYPDPKILVQLRLHPGYQLKQDCFHAILYPSEKTIYHYNNFYNTYLIWADSMELDKAVGKWGSVQLSVVEFQGRTFSAVRFVYQPRLIMLESYRLNRDENSK